MRFESLSCVWCFYQLIFLDTQHSTRTRPIETAGSVYTVRKPHSDTNMSHSPLPFSWSCLRSSNLKSFLQALSIPAELFQMGFLQKRNTDYLDTRFSWFSSNISGKWHRLRPPPYACFPVRYPFIIILLDNVNNREQQLSDFVPLNPGVR